MGSVGARGSTARQKVWSLCAGSTMDEATEPGTSGGHKVGKEEMQCSSTWLRIRTVSAAENRAGLFAGSWGVFATTDLCW